MHTCIRAQSLSLVATSGLGDQNTKDNESQKKFQVIAR